MPSSFISYGRVKVIFLQSFAGDRVIMSQGCQTWTTLQELYNVRYGDLEGGRKGYLGLLSRVFLFVFSDKENNRTTT
jgi:hypothetical protein